MPDDLLSQFPQSGGSGGDAFNIAIYTLVSMLILTALVYVLGKLLQSHKVEGWAKDEFIQVMINAALVGSLFMLMAPGSGLVINAFDSLIPAEAVQIPALGDSGVGVISTSCTIVASGTVLCFASNYLTSLSNQLMSVVTFLFGMVPLLDGLSKISLNLEIVTLRPLSGLSVYTAVFSSIMQSMIFLGIGANVENALLIFADKVALTLFLPIGVVLRCFFATRRTGGALIALSVGAYLIFPLLLSLNAIAVNQAMVSDFGPLVSAATAIAALNPFQTFQSAGDFADPAKFSAYLDAMGGSGNAIMKALAALPAVLVDYVALIVVQIVILPLVALIVTGLAIRELASLFGAEVHLWRLG